MVDAVPNVPITPASAKISVAGIKAATPDVILEDQSVPVDVISGLMFESIGGQELISIARSDLTSSNISSKSMISNINYINGKYSSSTLFTLPGGINSYFNNFQKDFNYFVPEDGSADDGSRIYLDSDGNIVIDVVNLGTNDVVDVQLLNIGTVESDIMG